MRFLVFQHIAIEHPGIFRDFFAADGITWDAVELDAGAEIPPLDGYDALWVMGGPMDVWEEDQHPWLAAEKRAIHAAVARELPYMGVCLGHQLLGAAMGGRVGRAAQAEVGILDVALTEAGRRDPLFEGMAPVFKALQWHGAEVAAAPPGAAVLAQSPLCQVQAMRVGRCAYGLQYHTELTQSTVDEWSRIPAYACSLDRTLGAGALPRLDGEARRHMADFNRDSRRLYDNFMALTGLRGRLPTTERRHAAV
jgi:GMP synthase-like glutamine amidotransferase